MYQHFTFIPKQNFTITSVFKVTKTSAQMMKFIFLFTELTLNVNVHKINSKTKYSLSFKINFISHCVCMKD